MAGAYRRTYTKPIPEGAERFKVNGKARVRYTDRRGKVHDLPLTKSGKRMLCEASHWTMRYTLPDGTVRREKGYTDGQATEQQAARREREAAGQEAGLILVDHAHLSAPIDSHLTTYLEDLRRTGRAEKYCLNNGVRLATIFRECKWPTLSAIRPDPLTLYLARLKDTGAAGKTINDYLAVAKAFCNWCVKQGRLAANPLRNVGRIGNTGRKYERRALNVEEARALLGAAPPYRRLVYRLAMFTGLRRSELKALQWGDVHVDAGEKPHIRLRAKATKARRADTLPLRSDLADELRGLRPTNADPTSTVIPPRRMPLTVTLRIDLKNAGIPHKDGQDRVIDFHSLRYTFSTMLQNAGTPLRTAMTLMRHTDPKLTLNTYTDLVLLDTAGAVEHLPDLEPGAAQEAREIRTGTDDFPETGSEGVEGLEKSRDNSGFLRPIPARDEDINTPAIGNLRISPRAASPCGTNRMRQEKGPVGMTGALRTWRAQQDLNLQPSAS